MQWRAYISLKRIWRILLGTVLLILFLFALSAAALAKGPTALTVEGPGLEQPLDIDTTENWTLLSKLMEQTGLWYATGDLPRPINAPTGDLGPGYTLTWVNGGPPGETVPDRTMIQYLYLHAEHGPLIHTPPQESLENWGQNRIGWFTAPKTLPDTLGRLGVPITSLSKAPALPPGRYTAALGLLLAAGLIVIGRRRRGTVSSTSN